MIPVGTRVKQSGYVTQRARDYWNNCGREPFKSAAKEALDKAIALRGTVIEHTPAGTGFNPAAAGLVVRTDEGAIHRSLPHLWVEA